MEGENKIRTVILGENGRREYTDPVSNHHLGPFEHINVFVGKNNSGKSRFLRFLMNDEQKIYPELLNKNNATNYWKIPKQIITNIDAIGRSAIPNSGYKTEQGTYWRKKQELFKNIEDETKLIKFFGELFNFDNSSIAEELPFFKSNDRFLTPLQSIYENFINELKAREFNSTYRKFVYFPILRGLRPINSSSGVFSSLDVYESRTKHDYNLDNSDIEIYSGLTMFEEIKRLLLGQKEDRNLIADFQVFLEKNVFGEEVQLIPHYQDDVLNIQIGNGKQIKIYDLGDGLQTMITLLFPLFKYQNQPRIFVIEEPETHLHPEWQSKLINIFQQFPQHQFFITTHSASFINASGVNVFSVSPEGKKKVVRELGKEGKREALNDLGYRPSDLMLSNYVLWVEGPTDKIYIRHLLNQIAPELTEGVHFQIMLFGGENFKHYLINDEGKIDGSILTASCPNVGVILDSDKKSLDERPPDLKVEIQSHFQQLEQFCWITEKREIENYIPSEIYLGAIKRLYPNQNIRLNEGDFADLGHFLDLDAKPSYKSTIKLPTEVFQKIQKNGNGTTDNINAKTLRNCVDEAIQKTASKKVKIDKIRIAKVIVKNDELSLDTELSSKLKELSEKIKVANGI